MDDLPDPRQRVVGLRQWVRIRGLGSVMDAALGCVPAAILLLVVYGIDGEQLLLRGPVQIVAYGLLGAAIYYGYSFMRRARRAQPPVSPLALHGLGFVGPSRGDGVFALVYVALFFGGAVLFGDATAFLVTALTFPLGGLLEAALVDRLIARYERRVGGRFVARVDLESNPWDAELVLVPREGS